ncbi:hypothetical protein [Paenibacillus sp. N3.4]|uniref:hypothetical protein n=1 Tax=Paenibacillus sp. N3.4 TaxID=2603222 RepID=UPI0011CC05F6|nr:hypothetical protein [Paenibacillus sp. N3.4]TXK71734.1 hypothetical protein FU659_32785 [Paenibacillus sp. N3.4]
MNSDINGHSNVENAYKTNFFELVLQSKETRHKSDHALAVFSGLRNFFGVVSQLQPFSACGTLPKLSAVIHLAGLV